MEIPGGVGQIDAVRLARRQGLFRRQKGQVGILILEHHARGISVPSARRYFTALTSPLTWSVWGVGPEVRIRADGRRRVQGGQGAERQAIGFDHRGQQYAVALLLLRADRRLRR